MWMTAAYDFLIREEQLTHAFFGQVFFGLLLCAQHYLLFSGEFEKVRGSFSCQEIVNAMAEWKAALEEGVLTGKLNGLMPGTSVDIGAPIFPCVQMRQE